MKEKYLITGGTGSFGNTVLNRLINSSNIDEIRIFSRDEKKQDDLRKKFKSNKLKFVIGDVRDKEAVNQVMKGVNYVFHAAALKQVPSCEFFPIEAVKTNVLGTENVLNAAIANCVKKIVCLSTDKAVYPINAMGTSKAMMEKIIIAKANSIYNQETQICITRYGNVMASRGSVIPLFIDQINSGTPITITDPNMTRFMMTLEDAVDLVLFAFKEGKNGDVLVQKSPASTIENLANAVKRLLQQEDHKISYIGKRHGEKSYESLLTKEEYYKAQDLGDYYRIPADFRDLNYDKFYKEGEIESIHDNQSDYNSNNTERLDLEGMIALLRKIEPFSSIS